jgi:Cu/Ag efflux protein CusF
VSQHRWRPILASISIEGPVSLWRAIVLMSMAVLVGVGLGYVRWGREARQLREAVARSPETRSPPAHPGPWTARGIVRILLPNQAVVFVTHETIPGVMPATTRAFNATSPRLLSGLAPGDRVRFTLERRGAQIVLVAIEREKPP